MKKEDAEQEILKAAIDLVERNRSYGSRDLYHIGKIKRGCICRDCNLMKAVDKYKRIVN
jgi:hypothetical protein